MSNQAGLVSSQGRTKAGCDEREHSEICGSIQDGRSPLRKPCCLVRQPPSLCRKAQVQNSSCQRSARRRCLVCFLGADFGGGIGGSVDATYSAPTPGAPTYYSLLSRYVAPRRTSDSLFFWHMKAKDGATNLLAFCPRSRWPYQRPRSRCELVLTSLRE